MSVTCRVVRDDGQEFLIDDVTWRITSDGLEGWDYVTPDVQTEQNVFGDGSYFTSERVSERDRTVTAVLVNRNLNEVMRDVVRSFFGVKRTFKVYLTYQGVTRWCEGKLISYSLPTGNIYDHLTLTFTILCPQPYLKSVDEFAQNIGEVIPLFSFPYISTIDDGFAFGEYKFAQEVELDNLGDVETYMKVVITAKGDVTNPQISKDDYFIKIIDTMVQGDVIIIDLVSKPPTVTKNGVNIIGRTDRNSSFENMKLGIGTSKVSYDADSGENVMDVVIYRNYLYGGM